MSAPAAAPLSADYGLPVAGDVTAWENVMRPCTGRLQLYKASSRSSRLISSRLSPTLVAVTVWIHCGLHYKPVQQLTGALCTPPIPGDMPPVGRPDSRFGFFPLRRAEPELDPFFSVRIFHAVPDGEVLGADGRWVLELTAAADAGHPLRFCARSRADAVAWERQLRMRSAPLTVVWSRHLSMVNGGGGGGGGVGAARDGSGAASQLSTVAALHGGARHVLANDVLAGVAGVAAELTQPEVYNLAVAAGPLVGVAFGALGFALRVFAAARSAFGAAVGVSEDLDDLCRKLRGNILPSLPDLPDDGTVDVGGLMGELGRLVSGVEVLAGELHHLLRSRRQRFWQACMSAHRGLEVGGDFQSRLDRCRASADELVQLIQLGLGRRAVKEIVETRHAVDAAAPLPTAQRALRRGLPALPAKVFNDWGDPVLPAAQLYAAVMRSDSTTCAAVGAHGMGGVGKTLACILVAHRIAGEAAGMERFPDGVHWVQLSQKVGIADVKQRVCDLATTVSGQLAVANELAVAVGRLGEALQAKSCLIIVDDVWQDRWAAEFIRAVQSAPGSCLLLSTRRQDIATRTNVSQSVSVDVLGEAAAVGVLMVYAEADGAVPVGKTDELVRQAVAACGGLALALAVMGSLVRSKGWTEAVNLVNRERDDVLDVNLDVVDGAEEYKGTLWACLSASYGALDGDEQPLWRARFQALCVIRPKERLPWTALAALWGGNGRMAVKKIARTLRDHSLVTLDGEERDGTLHLSLHDLVVEFLAGHHIMDQEQRENVHKKMVAKYCERSRVGAAETPMRPESTTDDVAVRALWKLPSDGFIERALPRLLCASGAGGREELLILLFDWRFIAWRVAVGSGGCGVYRKDGRTYLEDGEGVRVDVLDLLATVVEGAIVVQAVPLSVRLQQAAWEVTERFVSPLHVAGGEASVPLLAYLCDTARLCLDSQAASLYGASRLGLPRERRVFGCRAEVRSLCRVTNPSGDVLLIAGQNNGKLAIWEERSGSLVAELEGHTIAMTCMAVLNDGASGGGGWVVSGSYDRTVRVWDVDGAKCVAVLTGHSSRVTSLAVLDGGGSGGRRRVVSGSRDHTLRVWDVDGGKCVAVLNGHTSPVTCLAVLGGGGSGSGERVLSGSRDGSVRVWDVDARKCVVVMKGHKDWVTCLAVLDGGVSGHEGRVVSGSADGTVRVWDVDGRKRLEVLHGDKSRVTCLAVLNGGGCDSRGWVVSGSSNGTIRAWDVDDFQCVAVLQDGVGPVTCLAMLDGGGCGGMGRVVSASGDGNVRVWNVERAKCVALLDGHTSGVRCLTVLDGGGRRGGGRVVSGSRDRTVRVWDVDVRRSVAVQLGHTSRVTCFAVVDGGRSGGRVASGSHDRTVRVWQAGSGKCVAVLKGHTDWVTCLAVLDVDGSSRGRRVVSGSDDGTVRVWDVTRKRCVALLSGHTDSVTCLAVLGGGGCGGGGLVVSGSHDRTVRVWDVDTGKRVAVLEGHTDSVTSLAVLDGGRGGRGGRLVSASDDRTVRAWDVDAGGCVALLQDSEGPVTRLVVLDGGGSSGAAPVASRSRDGTVRVKQLDGDACPAVAHRRGLPVVAVVARWPLVRACALPATPSLDGSFVFVDERGMCALFDHDGRLRYIPGPPSASAFCCVSPDWCAWGTITGGVFFGRLDS